MGAPHRTPYIWWCRRCPATGFQPGRPRPIGTQNAPLAWVVLMKHLDARSLSRKAAIGAPASAPRWPNRRRHRLPRLTIRRSQDKVGNDNLPIKHHDGQQSLLCPQWLRQAHATSDQLIVIGVASRPIRCSISSAHSSGILPAKEYIIDILSFSPHLAPRSRIEFRESCRNVCAPCATTSRTAAKSVERWRRKDAHDST